MNQISQLKDAFQEGLTPGSKLRIMSAYFTLYAYNEIRAELKQADKAYILINPSKTGIQESVLEIPEEGILKNKLAHTALAREFAEWLETKAEVKKIKSKKIDGKMICIDSPVHTDAYITHADFSACGMGSLDPGGRVHLNYKIEEPSQIKYLKETFDSIWNNPNQVLNIKNDLLAQLNKLYCDNSPELVYFLTLYNLFGNFLEDVEKETLIEKRTGITETLIWNKLYDFQKDGVVGAINKIETYGGCIIADSVGLGKTFEALAVIKYYELRNNKVLVLAPKKLRDNWHIYKLNDKRNPFASERLFGYTLLNHTDLTRETGFSDEVDLEYVNWGNFDLVVIDESHNFRNASTGKHRMTRYEKLMKQIIQSGVKTKVLMLSATPVNKALNDIKNQIAFITEGNDAALAESAEIENISQTLRKAQAAFNLWNDLPNNQQTTENLLEYLNWDYFKLLDSLTIARSRKHIEKYYGTEKIGKFPERLKPKNVYSDIDIRQEFPGYASINEDIMTMSLCMYTPLAYVLPHRKKYYEDLYDTKLEGKASFKQSDREFSLKYLMKTNLLKRLESSIFSFGKTVDALISGIEFILQQMVTDEQLSDNFTTENEVDDETSANLDALTIGKVAKIRVADLDKIKYRDDLLFDLSILQHLAGEIRKVTVERDEKMRKVKEMIRQKIEQPLNPDNKKIILFTAFADTATYLYEHLSKWAYKEFGIHSGLVTGSNDPRTTLPMKKKDFTGVLINFSPRSKERNEEGPEIDLLIATDCISEGQNLQDCDYLINYDIHWNPVRIIQRFGRVDRLGSKNSVIQLVNFWPAMELDEYINLEGRVKGRMKLLDISATGEENVIEENVEMKDLDYRKQQLKKMQEEVVDIEELSGGVSITDLTLNDFRMDLVNFADKNKGLLEQLPKGIYAITDNINSALAEEIKPGVIFCLRDKSAETEQRCRNSLAPFHLIYMTTEGSLYFADKQVKHLLDLYRSLCMGRKMPVQELIKAFNKETHHQTRMEPLRKLLEAAMHHLSEHNEEEAVNLFSLGGLSLFGATESDLVQTHTDYELISYLVIR
ncbi:MAG: helicase-related protein [Odoribacter sp.]